MDGMLIFFSPPTDICHFERREERGCGCSSREKGGRAGSALIYNNIQGQIIALSRPMTILPR